jgi:hypothetical protein
MRGYITLGSIIICTAIHLACGDKEEFFILLQKDFAFSKAI